MDRRCFIMALSSAAAACAYNNSEPAAAYAGVWDWQFETSSFTANDGRGPWWLAAEGEAWEQLSAPIMRGGAGPWGRVRLVVEGELSAPGRHGHHGAYERELRVIRVIQAELIEAYNRP
jgi:hypothetical protein